VTILRAFFLVNVWYMFEQVNYRWWYWKVFSGLLGNVGPSSRWWELERW